MKNKSGKIAIFQISILIFSMFAFAFMVGEMGRISAFNKGDSCKSLETGISGECLSPISCNFEEEKNNPSCSGELVCCYDKPERDDKNIDLQTGLSMASTAANTYFQYDAIKEKFVGKNDINQNSITNIPTNAKGSLAKNNILGQATSAGGIVGSAFGKLGIGTWEKGTTLVKSTSGGYEAAIGQWSEKELAAHGAKSAMGISYSLAGIIKGATWGVLVNLGITWIGGALDPDHANLWDDVGTSVGLGIFAGQTALSLFGEGGMFMLKNAAGTAMFGPWGAVGVGAVFAIGVFLSIYDETRTEVVTFTCYPWAAELGGENCKLCNGQGDIPCTEYQCKSLGQACELINKEETGEPICYWKDPKDVTPPIMEPLESALLADFYYTPDNTISPPDRGVEIKYGTAQDTCLPAFTPIAFGVNTSEPSRCKIDVRRTEDFDSMMTYMGDDASFAFEHTQSIVLPGPDTTGNFTLANGGENSLYIRCQDPNGNFDLANFVFNYCVYDGPDTTPPLIVTTSLLNGGPIAFNQSSVDLTVYVNEPADCKWDYLDKSYDEMDKEMVCANNPMEFNAQMLYECETTLEGLISNKENKFYFKCEDQPSLEGTENEADRNENMESYLFTILGTLPLQIDSVLPDKIIDGPTDKIQVTLEVETSAGYNEGVSICGYKDQDETGYTDFFNTNSYHHTQDLWLDEDDYNYSIMCVDLGGNAAYGNAVFSVETDLDSPIIVRAYYEDKYMKLITDEKAICVYGTDDCNYAFEDGIEIQSSEEVNHFVEWNTEEDLYIKCKDAYDIQPTPQNTCSIVVRASEYYEAEE